MGRGKIPRFCERFTSWMGETIKRITKTETESSLYRTCQVLAFLKHELDLPVSKITWAKPLKNSSPETKGPVLQVLNNRLLCDTTWGFWWALRIQEFVGTGWSAFSKLQINSTSAGSVPKPQPSLVPWAVGDCSGLKVVISKMCFIWCRRFSAESCLFSPL